MKDKPIKTGLERAFPCENGQNTVDRQVNFPKIEFTRDARRAPELFGYRHATKQRQLTPTP